MIFRQLFDPTSSTYTYLLGDAASGEALVVDPVLEHWQRDAALLRELGLTPVATLETHVHADHVTGAWWLKREFGCEIAVSAASGAEGADRLLRHDDRVSFGSRHLQVRATPGHTRGCLTYVLDDASLALTGDCLMIRGTGRTDFQQGDARAMFRSIRDQIMTLPGECLIYPAHDYRGLTASSVAEERRLNPRIADRVGEGDFVGFMSNLNLPHPKLLEVAVPANLHVGRSDAIGPPAAAPAQLRRSCCCSGRGWNRLRTCPAECCDGLRSTTPSNRLIDRRCGCRSSPRFFSRSPTPDGRSLRDRTRRRARAARWYRRTPRSRSSSPASRRRHPRGTACRTPSMRSPQCDAGD